MNKIIFKLKIVISILLAATIVLSLPDTGKAQSAESFRKNIKALQDLQKGLQLDDDDKSSAALPFLLSAARQLPTEPIAQLALADAYINIGKPAEALKLLNKASLKPLKNFNCHGRMGLCYLQMRDPEHASQELTTALRLNQVDYLRWTDWVDYNNLVSAKQMLHDSAGANALRSLALALKVERQIRDGRDTFDFKIAATLADKMVKIKPELLKSRMFRGIVLLNAGMNKEAVSDFSYVIKAQPACALPYYFRADAYSNFFDFEHALKDYSTIIAMQPLVVAATDTAETGRCKNSGASYDETVVSLADIYYLRAAIFRRLNKAKEATADINSAIKMNPDDIDAYVLSADILAFSGQPQAALKQLETALTKDPKNVNCLEVISQTYERLGQHDKALATANRLIKISNGEPQAYACRGRLYASAKNWQNSIADYSVAIKEDESKELYKQRGNAYMSSGQSEKAVSDYTAALKCAGQADKEILLLRAFAFTKIGKIALAAKDRQAAALLAGGK